jgi:hypothetical protein
LRCSGRYRKPGMTLIAKNAPAANGEKREKAIKATR